MLEGVNKSMSALEVAHAVGLKTRKEVNPDLYALEKKGVVSMNRKAGPPLWSSAHRQTVGQLVTSGRGKGRGRGVTSVEAEESSIPSPHISSSADLSQVPEGDMRQRLLCILSADRTLRRTELELRCVLGGNVSRADVRKVLEELEEEGQVKKTSTIPTQWEVLNADSTQSGVTAGDDVQPSILTTCGYLVEVGPSHEPMECTPLALSVNQTSSSSSAVVTRPAFSASVVNEMNRNPVSALIEYCQASKIEHTFVDVKEYGPPHRKHFVVAVQLGNEMCEAAASTTKKEARRMAADLALQYVQKNYGNSALPSLPIHPILANAGNLNLTFPAQSLSGSFSDRMAQMVHDRYLEVQASVDYPQPGRKVIAGFVMEDTESEEMKIVSLGSGTRCITGDHMSMEGTVVNDSHAEVIARRSVMRFFYKQMQAYYGPDPEGTIFVDAMEESSPLLRVKSNLKFHLYISTAPCGDGAQFSRGDEKNRDPPTEDQHKPTMQGKQGLLRTKIEGGEGTIPTGLNQNPLTWDGVLRGERLRTMSCSDKVGRWNVLGLQGALLSSFMEPVYMSSLILGSLHHHGHLSRAVCCRFADVSNDLPPGFLVNHPSLGRVQGGDEIRRHTEKTSNFSLNWALGDKKGELLDGGNGRLVGGPPGGSAGGTKFTKTSMPSRVSKLCLYKEFIQLANVCNRQELLEVDSYKKAKELAEDFQQAKKALFKMCESKGYGQWMRKPEEEEHFDSSVLDRLNAD